MSGTTYILTCPYCGHASPTDQIDTSEERFVPVLGVFCMNEKCNRAYTAFTEDKYKTLMTRKMDALDLIHNVASAWEMRHEAKHRFDIPSVLICERVISQLMTEARKMLVETGRAQYAKEGD